MSDETYRFSNEFNYFYLKNKLENRKKLIGVFEIKYENFWYTISPKTFKYQEVMAVCKLFGFKSGTITENEKTTVNYHQFFEIYCNDTNFHENCLIRRNLAQNFFVQ